VKISIESVPHSEQRYKTPGDYFWSDSKYDTGYLTIRVSKMKDWRHEILIIVHELVECVLCKYFNIRETDITAFDENYESERKEGFHSTEDEPGNDPASPYRTEHFFAESVERLVAVALRVDWEQYSREVNSL
jgi:hypothetical protein